MKLPAVVIVAAFAGGILLGLSNVSGATAAFFPYPGILAGSVLFALAVALALAWRNWLRSAAVLSLVCWTGLGIFAAVIARRPLPVEHVLSRIHAQQLELRTPFAMARHVA